MLEKEKKFLDQKGVEYLWSKINMQDYPNNDTLIAVINAIDEGKMDKTTAIPLIEKAIAGQVPVVKSIDENGKPVEWEAGKFIKTINGKEPDGNGNIKVRAPYEVTLSYYEGLVTTINRTPQQIIEAERSSDKEVIYKLYIPIVTDDSETGPDIYATEVELKNVNENYNSYTGYQIVVKFGEKYPPIIIDGSTDSFYIDETWIAPTTPSDIPDTTSAKQYLVTNSSGEKVWTNLPITETIRIDLTDATRIMPDVIQNYSALTPAEMIQKGRYLSAYNLVFYREIRDHVGEQQGVVVDLIKDRGYKAFKNENGDYCLRVYFDNYAPIIVDATSEPSFYLDPDYVAPEPIIPETVEPHQYLTTNENGEKVWENKTHYLTEQIVTNVEETTGTGKYIPYYVTYGLKLGKEYTILHNGTEYKCTSFDLRGDVGLGNLSLGMSGAENTGEPFVFLGSKNDGAYVYYAIFQEDTTHTFSVTGPTDIATPLSDKFIPSNVPKVMFGEVGEVAIITEVQGSRPKKWSTVKLPTKTSDLENDTNFATQTEVATLQSAIDTLNGTGEGSVRDTVADAVATIVANAPEDFDTLKEVADWISNDTLGTADLLQRMTTAEEKIITLDVQADWNQLDESAKDFIKNKPVPITDNEIDAICGGDLISENMLVDTATGNVYKIYVENGKLSMKQVNDSSDSTELIFVDTSTDTVYKVYVENEKLYMMEVE